MIRVAEVVAYKQGRGAGLGGERESCSSWRRNTLQGRQNSWLAPAPRIFSEIVERVAGNCMEKLTGFFMFVFFVVVFLCFVLFNWFR